MGSVETRMTAVEAGLDSLRVELRERFEGTDGRLRVLTEGLQFLEGRTGAPIAPIAPQRDLNERLAHVA